MKEFKGRRSELSALQKKYDHNEFQMVVLYGRRRIGKTKLMNEFIQRQNCKYVSYTAVEQSEKAQLSIMTETVLTALAPELIGMIEFASFEKLFEFIGSKAQNERIIFFIDEYPYLAKQCPYIHSVLQKIIDTAWNTTKLYFVICGSLISFMKDEVLAESAPLHGRATLEMKLQPFNYLDTAAFVPNFSAKEKAIAYGLTNGVAKYIEQFDDGKSLEQNIIDEFFGFGGYFTEEQVKTVLTSERQNPALYNSIISAIATGHTKNSEIASCVGMDDITYPLKMLQKAEIIEKRTAKSPYYVLLDSMLVFWFRYVNKAISIISMEKGETYYRTFVANQLHDYMGGVFEKICKEYLMMKAGEGPYPVITEISDFQKTILDDEGKQRQIEIDLLGKNGKDILLIGECKFRNEKVDMATFEEFLEKVRFIRTSKPLVCMFSLSGYTEHVKENAGDVLLLTIDDLFL